MFPLYVLRTNILLNYQLKICWSDYFKDCTTLLFNICMLRFRMIFEYYLCYHTSLPESKTGPHQDRQSIIRSCLRLEEESSRSKTGSPGVRDRAGRGQQRRGHFRTAASPSAAMPRENYGEY